MSDRKHEIITFKVDKSLADAMEGIGNRSQFIRSAIESALGRLCPLCKGAGALSVDQQRHWEEFRRTHSVAKCEGCDALHLVCQAEGDPTHGAHR